MPMDIGPPLAFTAIDINRNYGEEKNAARFRFDMCMHIVSKELSFRIKMSIRLTELESDKCISVGAISQARPIFNRIENKNDYVAGTVYRLSTTMRNRLMSTIENTNYIELRSYWKLRGG